MTLNGVPYKTDIPLKGNSKGMLSIYVGGRKFLIFYIILYRNYFFK